MRHNLLFAVLLAAATPAAAATFDPLAFFAGRTEGRGTLKILLHRTVPVVVHGRGTRDGDTLRLDQTVIEGDKPPAERRWTFTAATLPHYTGTLTDAVGPVSGDVDGARLHLHLHLHGGIVADQRIDLADDGRSAHNRMTFRKFGIVVARLDETIRRQP